MLEKKLRYLYIYVSRYLYTSIRYLNKNNNKYHISCMREWGFPWEWRSGGDKKFLIF
jgi:peptidoglycan/xylan/chitin deacetylase (PgdA/CDA1 family)